MVRADARHIPLADESVHCVVTSPPYWGLRKYAGAQELIWLSGDRAIGSSGDCAHEWGEQIEVNATNHTDKKRWQHTRNGRDEEQPLEKRVAWLRTHVAQGAFCRLCGAWRGGFGLEPTIEMYVQHTVEILGEVRRVLRSDGVCFWNIGDSYATGAGKVGSCPGGGEQGERWKGSRGKHGNDPKRKPARRTIDWDGGIGPVTQPNRMPQAGLKPKDLCLIPFRVALAAQADGWWVRSVIIWSKRNPMPESVTDRPTTAHEYILLLTKSADYFWDAEVKEPAGRMKACGANSRENVDRDAPHLRYGSGNKQRKLASGGENGRLNTHMGSSVPWEDNGSGRNLRSVWTFPSQPYPEAHYATFPEELVRRCIAAGTSEQGCCPECGSPWERILDRKFYGNWNPGPGSNGALKVNAQSDDRKGESFAERYEEPKTTGWRPTCPCDQKSEIRPAIVFDPFAGSGTVGEVAYKMGRRFILSDLAYQDLQRQRVPPMAFVI